MAWVRRLRMAVLVAVVFAVSSAAPGHACQMPPPVVSVLAALARVAAADDPGADSALALALDALDMVAVADGLAQHGLEAVAPQVMDLLSAARRIADGGRIGNRETLKAGLVVLEHEAALLCARRLGDDPTARVVFQPVVYGGVTLIPERFVRLMQDSPPLQAAALVSVMLAVIGFLYLADAGLRLFLALAYNRRMCRIPATLEVGDVRCDGLVITLGRGGFRFVPLDPAGYMRIVDAVERRQPRLLIGDEVWPAQLSLLLQGAADFRFARRSLRLREQRALLAQSTITPYALRRFHARGAGKDAMPELR